MNAIIFGANGQDGYYLTNLLQQKGFKVTGVSRSGNNLATNLSSYEEVSKLIKNITPKNFIQLYIK